MLRDVCGMICILFGAWSSVRIGLALVLAQLDWRPTQNVLYFKRHKYFHVRLIFPIIFLNRVTFTNVVKSD